MNVSNKPPVMCSSSVSIKIDLNTKKFFKTLNFKCKELVRQMRSHSIKIKDIRIQIREIGIKINNSTCKNKRHKKVTKTLHISKSLFNYS